MLRRKLAATTLSALNFCLFGLGDSSYAEFNYTGKKLFKRLSQLGANACISRGDGDDQHDLGLYGALDPWMSSLWDVLLKFFPQQSRIPMIPQDALMKASVGIHLLENSAGITRLDVSKGTVTLLQNDRISVENHFQEIRHLQFQMPSGITYNPADVLHILPVNNDETVQSVLDTLGWSSIAESLVSITATIDRHLPDFIASTVSLKNLIKHYIEPLSMPKDRYFFELLSHFVQNPLHREKLLEFCTPAGRDDLIDYCYRPRRTCLEIIRDFLPLSVPVAYILDLFPVIKYREFSISSSPSFDPSKVSITVGVIKYRTLMKAPRVGMGSNWLASLQPSITETYIAHIGPGTMALPEDLKTPVIFIAPGLGIAPIRSMLLTRVGQGSHDNVLFHGCRYREKDCLYSSEFNTLAEQFKLEYHCAYSRDDPLKTTYVQDLMDLYADRIWDLLSNHKAYIYLSGSSKRMPTDVISKLKQIFKKCGSMSDLESDSYFKTLQNSRRYQQETWS